MDEQYFYVDSRQRNTKAYPNTNAYTMFMISPIKHVTRVDLVSAYVPFVSNPYIFLDIEQFRTKYGIQSLQSNTSVKNTTPIIQNYFAHIIYGSPQVSFTSNSTQKIGYFGIDNGFYIQQQANQSFKYYEEYEYKTSVTFSQPIESLDRLNIRWIDYNNLPVAFSDHSFMLRVYTTKMNIENYEPLKLPPPVPKNFESEDTRIYLIIIILVIGIGFLLFSG